MEPEQTPAEAPEPIPRRRVQIPKSVRFEVFKRDKFQCQYCGAKAPDVVLHVDHIDPVGKGGGNQIANLISSCEGCNLGKGDRRLDDSSALTKARTQLEQLQERREQIEMMMQWQQGLFELEQDQVQRVCDYWTQMTPGLTTSEVGKKTVAKWLRTFSLNEVCEAMRIAAEQYLRLDDKQHEVTAESWDLAFSKIPGICRVQRESAKNPDLRDLYYIRGILRKRLHYCNEHQAMEWLRAARSWDIALEDLKALARSVRNWTQFVDEIASAIDLRREEEEGTGTNAGQTTAT